MPINLKERDGFWHVVGTVTDKDGNKVRIRTSTGFQKHQKALATDEMGRILHKALAGELKPKKMSQNTDKNTVEHAVRVYLKRPSKPGPADHSNATMLAKSLGEKNFSRLKLDEVMEWAEGNGRLAPNSVARRLGTFSAMQSHAKNVGLDTPDLEIVKPVYDDRRDRWLNEEERDHLLDCCSLRIHPMMIVLFYTGVRIGELFRMKWQDVVGEDVYVTSFKGRKKRKMIRKIPLLPCVIEAMGKRKTGLVFPTYTGTQWNRNNFYKHFDQAVEDAGLEDFKAHDCRHTFASLLIQKGASLKAVAELIGHTSVQMTTRYAHLAPTQLKSTTELLGSRDTFVTQGISFASASMLTKRKKTGGYDRLVG